MSQPNTTASLGPSGPASYELDTEQLTHAIGVPLMTFASRVHQSQSAPTPFRTAFLVSGSSARLFPDPEATSPVGDLEAGPQPHATRAQARCYVRSRSTQTPPPLTSNGDLSSAPPAQEDRPSWVIGSLPDLWAGHTLWSPGLPRRLPPTEERRTPSFEITHPSRPSPVLSRRSPSEDGSDEDPVNDASPLLGSPSPTRRVHFPDDVVQSVSVTLEEDVVRLYVTYHRPWHTYLLMIISATCAALHLGVMASLTVATEARELRLGAAAAMGFLIGCFASISMLLYLAFAWRPTPEEQEFMKDLTRSRWVALAWLWSGLSRCGLLLALVLSVYPTSLLCYGGSGVATGCVITYLLRPTGTVTRLDAVGGMILVVVSLGPTAGSIALNWGAHPDDCTVVLAVFAACAGGACLFASCHCIRECSHNMSHLCVLTTSLIAGTLLLLIIAIYSGGLEDVPLGYAQLPLQQLPLYPDLLWILFSAFFLVLSLVCYRMGALYFDSLSNAAWLGLGSPLAVGMWHLVSLGIPGSIPLTALEVLSGAGLCVGCVTVLVAGYRHRHGAEVRIVLDAA